MPCKPSFEADAITSTRNSPVLSIVSAHGSTISRANRSMDALNACWSAVRLKSMPRLTATLAEHAASFVQDIRCAHCVRGGLRGEILFGEAGENGPEALSGHRQVFRQHARIADDAHEVG